MSMLGKNKHAEHEEGESWLISYADMMTLLFGFFVIMYTLSQVDESKFSKFQKDMAETFGGEFVEKFGSEVGHLTEQRQLRAFQMLMAMASPGEDMGSVVAKVEKLDQDGKAADQVAKAIKKTLAKDDAVVRSGQTSKEILIDVALPADMLFGSGSDQLTAEAVTKLQGIGGELAKMNGVLGIEVVGHSDGAPAAVVKGRPDNWALSSLRASAVARALMAQGLDRRRFKVSGMGDLEPLFPERSASGQWNRENMARNRRVQLIVKRAADDGGS